MAVAIPLILVAATVASTAVSVTETLQAGQAQKEAADFQSQELQQQALQAQQTAGVALAAQDKRQAEVLASIRATAAASGVSPDAGSAKDVFATSSEQAQINDMYTRYAGNLQAQGLQSQAELTTYGGKVAQEASYYTAAGQVVSGVGSLAGIGMQTGAYKKWAGGSSPSSSSSSTSTSTPTIQ